MPLGSSLLIHMHAEGYHNAVIAIECAWAYISPSWYRLARPLVSRLQNDQHCNMSDHDNEQFSNVERQYDTGD